MTGFNQRFFARLDAAAERTGVPAVARGNPRRRHLRWLPVVALVATAAGFAVALFRADLAEFGNALVMAGFVIGAMLPLLGPIKPWGSAERVDEFDRALRGRAFFVAFASVSFVAMVGIWLVMGVALLTGLHALAMLAQLRALAFTLMTLYAAVPTLYASWATRPIGEED
jgi:hypothetical protein